MGTALRLAGDCLGRGAGKSASGEASAVKPGRAQHLAAASIALAAGRDLLHTHFVMEPGGLIRGRSEWAPAITSASVTRALTSEIARWSVTLASFTSRLAASAALQALPRGPGTAAWEEACQELASASQWLRAVDAACRAGRAAAQVSRDPLCRGCGRPVLAGGRGSAAAGQVQVRCPGV